MIRPEAVTLEGHGVRLEPLEKRHVEELGKAAADGQLWQLWFTSVPAPDETRKYVETALEGQKAGQMLPWAVRELKSGAIVGSTRYHDIVAAADRVEIGWTWYAQRVQRSHVNTACKLLLFGHAFEALGAKKDGVIRHHWPRRDGTVRDSVLYSVLSAEWPDVKRHLQLRMNRHEAD